MDEMNCLSVRRIISTNVRDDSEDFVQHLAQCPACKSFYEKQLKFNGELKKAFEVDVPEGLAERVLVELNLNEKKERKHKYQWLAMAASILIVFVVFSTTTLHSPPALADAILEHVKYDVNALQENAQISLQTLNQLLKPHGVRADENIGQATHAGNCVIQDSMGAHIVFAGKNAPVTLIIVPEKLNDKEPVTIDDQQFKGVLMSTKNGTLGIVSEDQESLLEFKQRMKTSLMTFI